MLNPLSTQPICLVSTNWQATCPIVFKKTTGTISYQSNFRLHMMSYDFTISHVPGKEL